MTKINITSLKELYAKVLKKITFLNLIKIAFVGLVLAILPFSIFSVDTSFSANESDEKLDTAIVFGAGIRGDKPSPVLADRLDKSIELWRADKIKTILVSGDNRFENYNEPDVMAKYLIQNGIPDNYIIRDYAGRDTLDTCWRAKNIFAIKTAYIVTSNFHIPRSNFVCKMNGIESFPARVKDNFLNVTVNGYLRELFASQKAGFELITNQSAEVKGDGKEKTVTDILER